MNGETETRDNQVEVVGSNGSIRLSTGMIHGWIDVPESDSVGTHLLYEPREGAGAILVSGTDSDDSVTVAHTLDSEQCRDLGSSLLEVADKMEELQEERDETPEEITDEEERGQLRQIIKSFVPGGLA